MKSGPPLKTAVIFALAAAFTSGAPEGAGRLDRRNLLAFRRDDGAVAPVRSIRDWEKRRAEILAGAQAVMGPLPGPAKRVPLEIAVEEEADAGSFVRRRITFTAEPGSRVSCYLLLPKAVVANPGCRAPAVLCLMGSNNTVGNRAVVGLGGPNALPNRNYAQELAERGYIAIAPPYPLMADYQPDLKALGYQSGTMKAIWDNIRALDVLDTIAAVKPGGVGAIGQSLGGHNAIFTALFDERIRVVVSSCGFDSFLDYRTTHWARQSGGWANDRYMPRILDYERDQIPFDFHELIGALAPRPFLASAPLRDDNFKWQSVDRVAAAAAAVYRLYQVENLIRVEHPDATHDFPPAVRELAYDWLDRFLR